MIENRFRVSLAVPLVLLTVISVARAQYSGGSGTADDPYQIATAADLIALGETPDDYDKHFILAADIDLDPNLPGGKVFDRAVIAPDVDCGTPLYFDGAGFTGVFDGNGHLVSHLALTGVSYLGLFGVLHPGAVVSDVGLEAADIDGTDIYVGGLVADNNGGRIVRSYSTGVVSGEVCIGGLVGRNRGSTATSYNAATVRGTKIVGGLVGYNDDGSDVTISYSSGAVRGDSEVGGLVGGGQTESVSNCFWDVEVSGQSTSRGGTGLTTAWMQMAQTFLGWVACEGQGTWTIDEGSDYPRLRWENRPGKPIEMRLLTGEGTESAPYLIYTVADLDALSVSPCDWHKHFKLMADIDLSGHVYDRAVIASDVDDVAEGFQGTPFTGVFDGNGHAISHLTIGGESYLGLFGQLDLAANIYDLGLEVADVNGTGSRIAALAGRNYGSISRCHSTGTASGYDRVGGLVGGNGGNIDASYSATHVIGSILVGGLVGISDAYGSITASHSTGTVSGNEDVGGLVGINWGNLSTSYSTGRVSGYKLFIGGLAGRSSGVIATSYSSSTIDGNDVVGGLVGRNGIFSRGMGFTYRGEIVNCYSTGPVIGNALVGGLVGSNLESSITMSYSTGVVTGNEAVGGSVGHSVDGWVFGASSATTNFWDTETSGQASSAGGIGLTAAEMQTAATFLEAGWDFVGETENGPNDVWKIIEGQTYPLLSWQKYDGGTGEPNDPYLIYTAEHLNALGAEPNDYDKHFKLMADIDLSGYVYDRAVIAPDTNDVEDWFQGTPFTGVFEGSGRTISHLTITGGSCLGLFGLLDLARVSSLGLDGVDINGTGDDIGGLVGHLGRSGVVECFSTGVVSGHANVGGLVGSAGRGGAANSYSTCAVSGCAYIGGLVGCLSYEAGAAFCYSTGLVSGNDEAGGLLGGLQWRDGYPGYAHPTVNRCFWDIETSGLENMCGSQGDWAYVCDDGYGLTTAEMQTASTYLEAGWDLVGETENGTDDIWWILEGQDYPRLWWEDADAEF